MLLKEVSTIATEEHRETEAEVEPSPESSIVENTGGSSTVPAESQLDSVSVNIRKLLSCKYSIL